MQVNEYLIHLPAPTRSKLLALPHCCLAVFRSLDDAERYGLLRLISGPQHVQVLSSILQQKALSDSRGGDNASSEFKLFPSLAALNVVTTEANGTILTLQEAFCKNLKTALASLEPAGARSTSAANPPASIVAPTQADLIEYTKKCWEDMLIPLLSVAFPGRFDKRRGQTTKQASSKLVDTLISSGLIDDDADAVTHEGFQFLLSDIPSQVWTLIQSYVDQLSSGSEKTDAVSFLIFLATLPSGKLLPVSSLSETERTILKDWSSLGIVQIVGDPTDASDTPSNRRKSGSSSNQQKKASSTTAEYFCVTPLAWQIVSSQREGLAGGTEIGKWKRGIIVESNFMLYAYTDSDVLIALLDLFSEISTRLPNLVVARITRQSVRDALRRGISAEQIIRYLQQNRHSVHLEKQRTAAAAAAARLLDRDAAILMGDDTLLRLESSGSIVGLTDDAGGEDDDDHRIQGLPEQVAEQIQLWEEERTRFHHDTGFMYDDFDNRTQFNAVEKYARDLGVFVWSNHEKMVLFVRESGHEAMKAYIRKQS